MAEVVLTVAEVGRLSWHILGVVGVPLNPVGGMAGANPVSGATSSLAGGCFTSSIFETISLNSLGTCPAPHIGLPLSKSPSRCSHRSLRDSPCVSQKVLD